MEMDLKRTTHSWELFPGGLVSDTHTPPLLIRKLLPQLCYQKGAQESFWENLPCVVEVQRRVPDRHHWSRLKQGTSWNRAWWQLPHSALYLGRMVSFPYPNGCWGRQSGRPVPGHCWKSQRQGQELRGTVRVQSESPKALSGTRYGFSEEPIKCSTHELVVAFLP